ncbi:cell division protein FtsH [Candidatus Falkowbacteria bacterium RIFOXYB2_FULL_38_15]|uniref:ATP-dependent zinc metalloprotease FtsH n=1 Tax=Candidatus Falkowbacteria bacterium RIFOXYA2_FULL_38_12 TaxID=1797993 RepID=A0A1F5S4C0_9BACT|nr:MAG: cell division protein FtsH [Candidatus Falkowbacteria bacterium RIFOXYA2_FULL_38_12]OGF33705.1 MAG: cell division protein FtsH [Candidatus Falkowbacteria bacterium RIFOXYB2_FULL_38_15]OGF42278.1 MAG: cell division protein FtsH [Candidatus Falkowbacteria bacterium RIFOXYD2_FULL_39_16]
MKNLLKNVIIFLIVFLAIAGLLSTFRLNSEKVEKINLQKFVEQIDKEEIKDIVVEGEKLNIALTNGALETLQKEPSETLGELLKNYNVSPEKIKKINIEIKGATGWSYWLNSLLPFLIPLIFVVIIIYYMMRQVQGANSKAMMFGQSSARDSSKNQREKITFKDVAGIKEAKEELQEVVEFLKNPKKFTILGAKIPKGVLLMGSPGTGKTLLARAVAGEAGVPFFSISASEFVEMFVGVGAARVRDLFQKAQKNAPCIIFIDELDAIGRQRGAGLGGSHDEREQTLNQILVEMDGFDPNLGVIVLAATNRPDVLDPALLRPGRFDRRVTIDRPDMKDREEILKIHARNKPMGSNVDLKKIAQHTPGFSGADLANLLNEAAILTARRNKTKVGNDEIRESVEKVMMGPERKSHILSEKERKITAYHEAAHALVSHELPEADPVHKISIISRGQAAGYTLKLPLEDKHFHSRSEFIADLAVLLAGHTVEKEIFGEVTTGASSDLKHATRLVKSLISEYGMSEKMGARTFGEREEMIFLGKEIREQRDYSEKTAEAIDEEISHLLSEAVKTAREIIRRKKSKMETIVKMLLEKETIEKEEFEEIFTTSKT